MPTAPRATPPAPWHPSSAPLELFERFDNLDNLDNHPVRSRMFCFQRTRAAHRLSNFFLPTPWSVTPGLRTPTSQAGAASSRSCLGEERPLPPLAAANLTPVAPSLDAGQQRHELRGVSTRIAPCTAPPGPACVGLLLAGQQPQRALLPACSEGHATALVRKVGAVHGAVRVPRAARVPAGQRRKRLCVSAGATRAS